MVVRKIVDIDEELCNGCGECLLSCAEGALQIIDGKAKLVSDDYCDGLGACLGHCPQGAIRIIERESKAFDEEAVHAHLARQKTQGDMVSPKPSSKESALRQWPVQLNLVPVKAPFFDDRDLLVLADCVPVVYPELHASLLFGKSVVLGCPKFDDAKGYSEKLGEILKRNRVKSVTIVHMEVPCCFGLKWVVEKAGEASGKRIPVKQQVITIKGELK